MNNSIFSKNRMASKINKYTGGINFNDLSATSDAFMSDIRSNFNMRGGGEECPCEEVLEAFKNNNDELALYIIKNKNCCLRCSDEKGNTILHNLISCSTSNPDCEKTIDNLIENKKIKGDCIDIQNKEGETPILLAAKNNLFDIVRKLDKEGANKEIKDNKGFYIGEVDSDNSENDENITETIGSLLSETEPKSVQSHQSLASSQSVGDTEGIKNLSKIFGKTNETSDVQQTLDGVFDSEANVPSKNSSNKGNLLSNSANSIREYFMSLIEKNKGKKNVPDKTVDDNVVWLPVRDRTLGIDSEVEPMGDSDDPKAITVNLFGIKPETATDVEPGKSNYAPVNLENIVKTENGKKNDEVSETDQFIDILANKFSKEGKKSENKEETDLSSIVRSDNSDNSDNSEKKSDESIATSVRTSDLMQAIENIEKMGNKQQGGKKEKMMGYRNINLSEQSESSIGGYSNKYKKSDSESSDSDDENGIVSDDYDALYNESEYGAVNNELSRMMQRQRDNLHQQVLDMIMSLLNKGELVKDSETIPATERNAKLIKAYIYRQVSEKNPQMGGLDKILSISKMSEQQIADMVSSMPDLDD